MIRLSTRAPEEDVDPVAIFWRQIEYFSCKIRTSEDDLDVFSFATFSLGNYCQFEIRRYNAHPPGTCTLYFSSTEDGVPGKIDQVITPLHVPKYAIAWQHGDVFEFGVLNRSKHDRLKESEARNIALKIASLMPGGRASTEQIKDAVPAYFPLSAFDMTPSPTRRREQLWQQIVRNVISHNGSPRSLFSRGLARKLDDGIVVTDKGFDYLNRSGFCSVERD